MNIAFSARCVLACAGLLGSLVLSACGGGTGGAAPPTQGTSLAATPAPAAASSFAPVSVPLVVSTFSPSQSVDPTDAQPQPLATPQNGPSAVLRAQRGAAHLMPLYQSGTTVPGITVSADRRTVTRGRAPSTIYVGYPGDLYYHLYNGTGFVLGGSVSHDVFVNCPTTCWGNVGRFLVDFYGSSFVGVLNQYIGLTAPNRYAKGAATYAQMSYVAGTNGSGPNPVVGESDLLLLVYAAASQLGAGYGNIYHIFLPPNVDTCFDKQALCYSPDYTPSFAFCGYHSSVTFGDIGHVLYTVQPYADVHGCNFTSGANAVGSDDLIDSQDSILLHEVAETITDPDPDSAWISPILGEIGDVCTRFKQTQTLSGTPYTFQFLYSNLDHACTNGNLH